MSRSDSGSSTSPSRVEPWMSEKSTVTTLRASVVTGCVLIWLGCPAAAGGALDKRHAAGRV